MNEKLLTIVKAYLPHFQAADTASSLLCSIYYELNSESLISLLTDIMEEEHKIGEAIFDT